MKCTGKVTSVEATRRYIGPLKGVFEHENTTTVGIDLGKAGHAVLELRPAAARAYRLGRRVEVEIRPRGGSR